MENRYDRKRFHIEWLIDEGKGKRRLFTCAQIDDFAGRLKNLLKLATRTNRQDGLYLIRCLFKNNS